MAILNSLFGDVRKTGVQNPFASMTSPVPTVGTMPATHPLPRGTTPQGAQPSILGGILNNHFPNAWPWGGWGNQGATMGGLPDWLSQLFGRLRGGV